MNRRTAEIVQELAGSDVHTIAALAERHKVSQRTIRNDLDAIDDALRRLGKAGIRLERGGRVICMDDPTCLLGDETASPASYHHSKEERVAIAAALVALADAGTTLGALAESLLVSRTTVINDLDDIKAAVNKSRLTFVSKASKGLRAEGSEYDRRRFVAHLIGTLPAVARGTLLGLPQLLSVNVESLAKIVGEQGREHGCVLTDAAAESVVTYLHVSVARMREGHVLDEGSGAPAPARDSALGPMAAGIMELVGRYCHVEVTPTEAAALCERLDHQQFTHRSVERGDAPKVQMVTRQLIDRISDELCIDLTDDFAFFENLANHLDSVLQATPVDYPDTPLIREVIRDNEAVAQAVRACDDIVCRYVDRELDDLEIGYIVLHVCAAIERKKRRQAPLTVVVACNSGVGTSQLLRERLRGSFNIRIARTCTSDEACAMGPTDADLIISTVPLDAPSLDWVLASPLLSADDTNRISAKLSALRASRNLAEELPQEGAPTAEGLLDQLAPVIYDLAAENAPALMRAVHRVVSSYFSEKDGSVQAASGPSARELLMPSHIRLDVSCADWREAVRESAQVLLKGGYIEERYVDAMISNIEENGPYVVLTPGFAMPHEGIGAGALEVGLSLVRLAEPVEFGEEELDPVEFVCCLAAVDHTSHLRAFFNLVNLMRDGTFRARLHRASTPEDAAALIERAELGLDA